MFLLSRFRGANLRWMADLTFDSQLSRQVQKPVHRSGRFQAHAHRARKFRIKLPHAVTFVEQSCIHDLPGGGIQHRQRLLASVQIASYNSHSASFGPSAVRVNTETVYSGRSEADLVMASIGKVGPGTDGFWPRDQTRIKTPLLIRLFSVRQEIEESNR